MRRQLDHLRRRHVGAVRDRVVVEHARERRGADDRIVVRLRLTPVATIDVRRQHHQRARTRRPPRAPPARRTPRSPVRRCRRRAARRSPSARRHVSRMLTFSSKRQRCRLAERSERDDAVAAGLDCCVAKHDYPPFQTRDRRGSPSHRGACWKTGYTEGQQETCIIARIDIEFAEHSSVAGRLSCELVFSNRQPGQRVKEKQALDKPRDARQPEIPASKMQELMGERNAPSLSQPDQRSGRGGAPPGWLIRKPKGYGPPRKVEPWELGQVRGGNATNGQ